MKQNFDESLKRLLIHEGGNDDDPRDPGGRTSRGILQSEWNDWRRGHFNLPADVWEAPQDQIEAIYKQNYWDKLRCDDLPSGVDYAVFDYGVNSGILRAAKVLQGFVQTGVDGEVGPLTVAAAKTVAPEKLINSICDQRLAFLKGLNTWDTFGRGWSRRVSEVRTAALAMASKAASVGKEDAPPSRNWISVLVDFIASLFKRKAPPIPPAPPADTKPPWMTWAAKEVGFHESGDNRGIEKYISLGKCGSVGDPWCAIFVNAALETGNIPGSRSAMARSFERNPAFVKLAGPAYGAIVTMWRGSPDSGSGHVFFYAGENDSGIIALGGNQNDQVRYQYEPRNRVVGYYWPKNYPLPAIGPIRTTMSAATAGTET